MKLRDRFTNWLHKFDQVSVKGHRKIYNGTTETSNKRPIDRVRVRLATIREREFFVGI